ncbi:MAG: zinc-dependent alcohol dehydrogenase family protein [Methylobacter tundripaludum]|uniref:NADPH2:quinone reductase n=1 Tax=Methylobacter tundripaludum TaxID=173365 RepID=A0A2S6GPZ7_9GAMM|nr:zinc-dependent alcohol dehydrogenase family protein [Methylobacter tundripaludum]MCK9637806.1 zinc-dependent alcohol dehydrogenase family protein [Methylobacter tundripaludum]PPK67276.1 NADPH2:quinone reductase [Methylobacter tundripaludum]
MKAIMMTAIGNPDVLELQDIAEPEISTATQVKVRLKAAGVNPVDTKIRRNGLLYDNPLPAVLGCDGAGEVVETGSAVSRFKPGDKVWFCHGGLGREQGNYAEYNVLDQRWVSLMPETSSFTEAAALPLVLITAWGGLIDRGGLQSGQTVLIHAGAGGVGHVAIQLAKLKGARVITTVSSEQKAEFVQALGADEVIRYTKGGFADAVNELTDGKGADLVFDTVGAEVFKQSIQATAHFGRLVTLLDPGELNLAEARIRNLLIGFELMLTPMLRDLPEARDKHVEILNQCAQWLEKGQLKTHIGKQLSLAEAAKAHELIETGHSTGKIVLIT